MQTLLAMTLSEDGGFNAKPNRFLKSCTPLHDMVCSFTN